MLHIPPLHPFSQRFKPTRSITAAVLVAALRLLAGCSNETPSSSQAFGHAVVPVATVAPSEGTGPSGDNGAIGDLALADNPNVALGTPTKAADTGIAISRGEYVLSWNKDNRVIDWAAWRLKKQDLGDTDRQDDFSTDGELQDYLAHANVKTRAVGQSEFGSSCLDRGHQVPSADRTIDDATNSQTFLMSNMLPQTAYLNRGSWAHLEQYTRRQLKGADATLYVFAGPIFGPNPAHIGPKKDIAVPTKNFKIIVKAPKSSSDKPQVLAAVIMPNVTSKGTDPMSDKSQACADQDSTKTGPADDWQPFQTTVAAIEAESGLTFGFLH